MTDLLHNYVPRGDAERADLERAMRLLEAGDPWHRSNPVHFTASALIVHPPTGRVLLRWHERQQAWLQIGGHGDPGETSPLDIALREGREETGLTDLVPWPAAELLHVVVVPVPASPKEPAHDHADLRFLLATAEPEAARPEKPTTPLRWLTIPQAYELTTEDNLRETLDRAGRLLAATP
ncbi:MAG: NUDIX domain-containing protein [Microbispora sp.]|nr:NUDIX domain-containing protein [Microbispora sp.]